ncbi:MAG: VWA domain-containing protein [Spirochaetes bacterium]|nr:VWA domain-containing protein [Spirochaetota bacterium]
MTEKLFGDFRRVGGRKRILASEIIFVSAVIVSSIALLRPQYGEELTMRPVKGKDVVIVIDVSRSMLGDDVTPSRLDRAKAAVKLLRENAQGRYAIIIFAGEAFMLCPLTDDAEAFSAFIDSISTQSIGTQGTDIGKALAKAYQLIAKKELADKFVYLISDGEDHGGNAEAAAEKLKAEGITVYTSSVGKDSGSSVYLNEEDKQLLRDDDGEVVISKADFKTLRKIADITGGRYYDINDSYSAVFKIADKINDSGKQKSSRLVKKQKEKYQYFVMLFFLLIFAESVMWRFKK